MSWSKGKNTDNQDTESEEQEEEIESKASTSSTSTATSSGSSSSEQLLMSGSISCLNVSVPCDELPPEDTDECPSLENVETAKIQEYVSDKDIEVLDAEQFSIRQSIGGFKPDTHYWFVIRNEGEIRFIAPYATDVVDFFTEHYFIEDIGHTSNLPLDEFISSYCPDNPGKVVKYAGTFQTDSTGKIIKWSNDSGHFAPSIDYAAAIAKALGITDAMFIPWNPEMEDTEQETIFYQQYKTYKGPYSAHSVPYKSINYLSEGHGQVFYPHDYHTWYKYHGPQSQSHNHHDMVHHHHLDHHGMNYILAVCLIVMMVALCGIGAVTTVFYGTRRRARKVIMDEEDTSDEEEDEEEDDDEER